jgi:fatty-acyl-CoA synthase
MKYCLEKVGIKTLIMSENFKTSNYVDILNACVPEIENSKDMIHSKDFPNLKHVILLSKISPY